MRKILPKILTSRKVSSSKKERGFSLIELLVVISILMIIFAVAVPNYRAYQRQRLIDLSAKQIISDLRLAQQYALSGNKPNSVTCTSSTTLDGYGFTIWPGRILIDTSIYYYYLPVCSGTLDWNNRIVRKLPNKVALTMSNLKLLSSCDMQSDHGFPDNPPCILFKVLGNGAIFAGASSVTITVGTTESVSGLCILAPWFPGCQGSWTNARTVTVTSGGEIK